MITGESNNLPPSVEPDSMNQLTLLELYTATPEPVAVTDSLVPHRLREDFRLPILFRPVSDDRADPQGMLMIMSLVSLLLMHFH
jgi:hypothetical protein